MKQLLSRLSVAGALAAGSSALAQDAVQWRVEDGGNGHWYQAILTAQPITWSAARAAADAAGSQLATFGAPGEFAAIAPIFAVRVELWVQASWWRGPWIGAFQDHAAPDFAEPASGWYWIDGTPISSAFLELHGAGNPNNFPCCEDFLQLGENPLEPRVNDVSSSTTSIAYLVEWSSDCNSDGIVDFGQIRAGELDDTNANNIPDCCEQGVSCAACPGDIDESGAVDGVDLAIVLTRWGQSSKQYPRADANGDGLVDGSDLSIVLNGWGACP